jgi:hypothetical protein
MKLSTLTAKTPVLASLLTGLVLTACQSGDPSHSHPSTPGGEVTEARQGGSGVLPEPRIPTEAEVKAMEALTGKPRLVLPDDSQPDLLALSKAAAADVNVGFNDYGSLAQIKDKAYATFADAYFQWVTPSAYAVVVPMQYGHFHLGYENATDCFAGSNGFVQPGTYGTLSAGKCIQKGDAATRFRNLGNHIPNQSIQFYVYDRARIYTFDFKSFYLPPTSDLRYGHVQIWIKKKATQQWRYWADLPPATTGFTWHLPQTGEGGAQAIDEVRITSPTPNGSFNWTIDNLMITNIR